MKIDFATIVVVILVTVFTGDLFTPAAAFGLWRNL